MRLWNTDLNGCKATVIRNQLDEQKSIIKLLKDVFLGISVALHMLKIKCNCAFV